MTDAKKIAVLLSSLQTIESELDQWKLTGEPPPSASHLNGIKGVIRDALIRVGESDG